MKEAKVRFAPEMEVAELQESKCPVLSNTLGTPHEGVPSKGGVLCDQITNAVKWKQNVEWMLQDGVDDLLLKSVLENIDTNGETNCQSKRCFCSIIPNRWP